MAVGFHTFRCEIATQPSGALEFPRAGGGAGGLSLPITEFGADFP